MSHKTAVPVYKAKTQIVAVIVLKQNANQNLSELVLLLPDCLTSLWKRSLSDGVDVARMHTL